MSRRWLVFWLGLIFLALSAIGVNSVISYHDRNWLRSELKAAELERKRLAEENRELRDDIRAEQRKLGLQLDAVQKELEAMGKRR